MSKEEGAGKGIYTRQKMYSSGDQKREKKHVNQKKEYTGKMTNNQSEKHGDDG